MSASSFPGPVTATQVGSFFVGRYYQVLREHPELTHQFYTESSTMVRVDGDVTDEASTMLQIHNLLLSINLTAIEVKTINSLPSWSGGIVVMVSGLVKTKDFLGRRKFVQTFFLAPQEKGYFVQNDIFHFFDEEIIYQHPAPTISENIVDAQLDVSSPIPEPPVPDYVLEEEASEYINSVNIEHVHDDEYSVPDHQQYEEVEPEHHLENAYTEDRSSVPTLNTVPVDTEVAVEEHVEEPRKKTYASILRAAQGHSVSAVANQQSTAVTNQQSFSRPAPVTSDWSYNQQPAAQQPSSAPYYEPDLGAEVAEDGLIEDEGLSKSVYVRNLPSTVTNADIEEVFMDFGSIRPDGVAIKFRKEIGICYAFVEFEDMLGVHNALKASPVQLAGRPVYIEERRANSSNSSRGGRRGRGRGSYQADMGRGRFGAQYLGKGDGDYGRVRGNGSYSRGSQ